MNMTTQNRVVVNVRADEKPWLLHTRDADASVGNSPDHVITITEYPIVTYIEGTTDELRRFVARLSAIVDELDR